METRTSPRKRSRDRAVVVVHPHANRFAASKTPRKGEEIRNDAPPLLPSQSKGNARVVVDSAVSLLRRRLFHPSSSSFSSLLPENENNKRILYDLLSQTISQSCNNSVLLLGPRGCGKSMVLNQVLKDIHQKYPERVSAVCLNGLIHTDDIGALKEIAKQLCTEHELTFSKSASFDENSQFLTSILRECALAHKSIVFILDEFDLFAQVSKQKLLYNLLNIMQSSDSQAAVIGISSRMDADQLLEKRVRSRFSHRKLLFLPPLTDDLYKLLHSILSLPSDSSFPYPDFAENFNASVQALLEKKETKVLLQEVMNMDLSPRHVLNLVFCAVCSIERDSGILSLANFKAATQSLMRKPKLEALRDASVLELYLLVSMKRLEGRERESYTFMIVLKEYKSLHDTRSTCDLYSEQVCLRAFENLLERQLITYVDGRINRIGIEYRPVKLLVSSFEMEEGLKTSPVCPMVLRQWFAHEKFK